MSYKNAFRLVQIFLLLPLILLTPSFAKERGDASIDSQSAPSQVSGMDVSLEPLSGTKILSTKTDAKGSFRFTNVAPGSYKLRIGCSKTDAAGPDATVSPSQKCYAEMRIVITEKSTGVITGSIRKEGT